MAKPLIAILMATAVIAASAAPAPAFGPNHGMPREPVTKAGKCAKANQGFHIPYRGWRTRNRLGYSLCMWW